MSTKLKKVDKSDDKALIEAVCSSAHQIWQAGLGAFSKAQEEGSEMFSDLVQEGEDLQKRTQSFIGEKSVGVADSVTKLAEAFGKQASGSWEKIEEVLEDRVARTLHGIGLPTQEDIKSLGTKIDELNKSVHALTSKKTATTKAPAKKAATKTAAKKASSKAVAARAATRRQGRLPASAA